jgi:hypothetical protein
MLIEVEGVSKRFGGLRALDDVSLIARTGEVTAIIGPNGAGKSTLLGCLSGMIPIDAGHIRIDGRDALLTPLSRLVQTGITRTFQNIRLSEASPSVNICGCPGCHGGERSGRGAPSPAARWTNCSTRSACPPSPISDPRSYPTANAEGWRSHAAWPPNPCCS